MEGFANDSRPSELVLSSLWGLAGVVGLAAFWFWVFARANLTRRIRTTVAIGVLVGVGAIAPLLTAYAGIYTILAAMGFLLGIVISLWLLLPNLPLNPDAQIETSRAGQLTR